MLINNKILISLLLSIGLLVSGGIFYLFGDGFIEKLKIEKNIVEEKEESQITHDSCLGDDETVEYELIKKNVVEKNVKIFIKDNQTSIGKNNFEIKDIYGGYHPIELHKCGIYVIRMFNYNSQIQEQNFGFRVELWEYQYNGQGKSLLTFSEVDQNKIYKSNFSYDFRFYPNEQYVVLEKSYLGKDDYTLVIKDLNTKEDIFALLAKDIVKQYPNIIGSFRMREWSKDGRYFWGHIFEGAYVRGYFRIDIQNWKVDIFEAPDGAMGGLPLNIDTGYVVIQPGHIWVGIEEVLQELKERYRKEGRRSHLYVYNLFTKEKILIETVDEPLWSFKSRWISDAELQYELPNGEKKIYIIENSTNY